MKYTRIIALTLLGGLALSPAAMARDIVAKYRELFKQPWTPPAAAHRSRVVSCETPVPMDRVAFDDFGFHKSGNVVGVKWWGELFDSNQVGRPYYIAFYTDSQCRPDTLIYETCVVPEVKFTGVDCTGANVCTFRAPLAGFTAAAKQRYWIQISENDAQSANPGQDDFRWSSHQPIRGCPAVQSGGDGEFHPIIDPCNQKHEDMAFELLLQAP